MVTETGTADVALVLPQGLAACRISPTKCSLKRKVSRVPGILKMPCLRSFSTPSLPACTGTVLFILPQIHRFWFSPTSQRQLAKRSPKFIEDDSKDISLK